MMYQEPPMSMPMVAHVPTEPMTYGETPMQEDQRIIVGPGPFFGRPPFFWRPFFGPFVGVGVGVVRPPWFYPPYPYYPPYLYPSYSY
jgi:hypothetical protein